MGSLFSWMGGLFLSMDKLITKTDNSYQPYGCIVLKTMRGWSRNWLGKLDIGQDLHCSCFNQNAQTRQSNSTPHCDSLIAPACSTTRAWPSTNQKFIERCIRTPD